MRRYTVIVAPAANHAILTRALAIAGDCVDHAIAWEQRVRATVLSLADAPTRFSVDPEASRARGRPVRKCVFERTYLIFYEIDEEAGRVDVVRFRHGAMQPEPDEP